MGIFMRLESDLLGIIELDDEAPHGAQSQRTINVYPIENSKILGDYPLLLQTILEIKKSCAITNINNNELDAQYGRAIVNVIDDLLLNIPELSKKYFVIHAYHGGGGVGINMMINEIIANLANQQFFGEVFGSYAPIHPNNHINLNHSTSDLLKSAIHIAVIKAWQPLYESLIVLEETIMYFIAHYGHQKKISRTCLQDAIEITYENLFSGYLFSLQRHIKNLNNSIDSLHEINMGGNIIGRRGDCSEDFFTQIIDQVAINTDNKRLRRTENLFDASQNNDLLIQFSSLVSQLSSTLIKIAKDLRIMSSGPETGLNEIVLPAVQQGSSAMPGKINPNIPEYMIQTAFQVMGICHGVNLTQAHDELDYSPWQTFIGVQLLDAVALLTDALPVFARSCIHGTVPNTLKNNNNIETIIPLMVKLMKKVGYANAVKIYKDQSGNIEDIQKILKLL